MVQRVDRISIRVYFDGSDSVLRHIIYPLEDYDLDTIMDLISKFEEFIKGL